MNMQEKIDYIINNDGSEGGDGFSGLDTFLKYCLIGDFDEYKTLREDLEPIVEYWYRSTKLEVEQQESYDLKIFSQLPNICLVYRNGSDGEKFTKVNDLLFDFKGDQVEYTDEEFFIVEQVTFKYGVV